MLFEKSQNWFVKISQNFQVYSAIYLLILPQNQHIRIPIDTEFYVDFEKHKLSSEIRRRSEDISDESRVGISTKVGLVFRPPFDEYSRHP